LAQQNLAEVKKLLAQYEKSFLRSAVKWRVSYRALLVTSAVFSSFAAIIGKLEFWTFMAANDLASILAALAAVSTTLIAALDFEVNWRINSRSHYELNIISLAAEKSDADPDQLLSELQDVIRRRNEGHKQD
jgi:hypothetical protein